MIKKILLFIIIPAQLFAQSFSKEEISRWNKEAKNVNIIRDNYGVPHIYGKSDADAVFGLMYSQCEENFQQVELNNLEMLGRLSEVYGKQQLYEDLQMRLIYDTAKAIHDYKQSPQWLKKLCDAAADGVNYYIYKHPETKPLVLKHFEPWFSLMRTNGSISATQNGGITLSDIKNLYPLSDATAFAFKNNLRNDEDPPGSNGFAVSPFKTQDGNAILYINPHVTFYYRTEVQMVSNEGLNAYGGVTWGTFFVFQGFNQYCGWMHTSGETDVADLFKETVVKRNDSLFTQYDKKLMPVSKKEIVVRYKKNDDDEGEEKFTAYYTIHGPVMGSRNGQWLSLRENNRSLKALMQSWLRTKTKGFADFKKVMTLRSNTSDNTVFADNKGNIAYWHGNFVPHRNNSFDYSVPVDGSTSASDWHGIFALDSIVHVYNPKTGFIQNCNSTPFSVSGSSSPRKEDYPVWMAPDGENFRAINAIVMLDSAHNITVEKMIAMGYNHYLAFFDVLVPELLLDYHTLPADDSLKNILKEPISLLEHWNRKSAVNSIATTIAIEYGYEFIQQAPGPANRFNATDAVGHLHNAIEATTLKDRMNLLNQTIKDLIKRFGKWQVKWGDQNRYQRPADKIFDDNKPSLPVGIASSLFGSIPSFAARRFPNTEKRYGVGGNSFIACVEFGKRIKAKSIVTGGQSFDPLSKHYSDQAQMFIDGEFKDVLFYKEDVLKYAERNYHPGE